MRPEKAKAVPLVWRPGRLSTISNLHRRLNMQTIRQLAFDFQPPKPISAPVPSCWQERHLKHKHGLRPTIARIYVEQIMGHGGEVRHAG